MKIAMFDTHPYDRQTFDKVNERFGHEIVYFEPNLTHETIPLAAGFQAVCAFVNDCLDAEVLRGLKSRGVRMIALRSAGFNNVNLKVAHDLGLPVVRVPEYSPHAVAEHAVALALSLIRHIPRAYTRVREANFSLEGLVGFNLYQKTVGVVGTGKIGSVFATLMKGFGCRILACDLYKNEKWATEAGVTYVPLPELLAQSDLISLHVPLTPQTRYIINPDAVQRMKKGTVIVNTGRGALIDSVALIQGLKEGIIGGAALDVYEEEERLFFRNLSNQVLQDDVFARLLTFPNVLVTSHQAFLTVEALTAIAETTLANISAFEQEEKLANQVPLAA